MDEASELARRMVDAFNRLSVDEALRISSPDIELTTLLDPPGAPKLRGRDGVRQWFERIDEIWAFIDIRDWRFEERGDWILLGGSARVRGRASPHEMELEWASAAKLADGRVVKLGLYLTRAEAIAAIEAD